MRFWRVLREPTLRERLIEMIALTPFRVDFCKCVAEPDTTSDPVAGAHAFLVACNQARNGCPRRDSDWAYNNKYDGKNGNAWAALPTRLAEVGQRLKRVQVESLTFEDILHRYDSPDTLFLLDPPYLPETRRSTVRYRHECSRDDHVRLLRIAHGLDAMVALCAYRSDLYDGLLDGWHRTDIKGKSYAGPRAKGRKLPDRVLSVYTSYEPPSK